MISELKHLPINWKNGMPFSQAHLSSQYLAVADSIRDVSEVSLTSFNYGILGGASQKKFSESFRDNINNEKVEVSFCRAITKNGSRIEILNQNWPELSCSVSELAESKNLTHSKQWYLLLIIDPFTRVPDGIEDEQESPRRKPFTRPTYRLELMSKKDLMLDNLANALPIAKFEVTASGLRKIEDYIPPCTKINSHEKLLQKYEIYDSYLSSMKEYAVKIISKVKHKRKSRENNQLADDIGALCQQYLNYFVANYDEYRLTFMDCPPIKLLEFFAKLTRSLYAALEMAYDKGHVLKYFNQYATSVGATEINSTLKNTFESSYIHFDIVDSLAVVDNFLTVFEEIFKRLEKLDYRELAPRDVVITDKISSTFRNTQQPLPNKRRLTIRRTGNADNLGDELNP